MNCDIQVRNDWSKSRIDIDSNFERCNGCWDYLILHLTGRIYVKSQRRFSLAPLIDLKIYES